MCFTRLELIIANGMNMFHLRCHTATHNKRCSGSVQEQRGYMQSETLHGFKGAFRFVFHDGLKRRRLAPDSIRADLGKPLCSLEDLIQVSTGLFQIAVFDAAGQFFHRQESDQTVFCPCGGITVVNRLILAFLARASQVFDAVRTLMV